MTYNFLLLLKFIFLNISPHLISSTIMPDVSLSGELSQGIHEEVNVLLVKIAESFVNKGL
jgi:hypothetical protein